MCPAYDGRHGQQAEGAVDITQSCPPFHVFDAILPYNCKGVGDGATSEARALPLFHK